MSLYQLLKSKHVYLSVLITLVFSLLSAFLALNVLKEYGLSLFIFLPFLMSVSTTIIYTHNNDQISKSVGLTISIITLILFCFGLLIFAFEGLICIAMSAPIGIVFNVIAFYITWNVLDKKLSKNPTKLLVFLIASLPILMGIESKSNLIKESVRPIVTSIEINATPNEVWKNVIEFPILNEPTELIFKTGIAYPINAEINGQGVGAIRNCNFSTGSFVEPITVWDEPNLLQFDVKEQPEPMEEVSFYDIHPNHLHGYFVSKKGQFKLTKLANGNTKLEGTTWYYNKIKPTIYWNIWSDFIIHQIHLRVLNHIKIQSEK